MKERKLSPYLMDRISMETVIGNFSFWMDH